MTISNQRKPWLIAGLLAVFVASCASTQEEYLVDGDGTAGNGQTQAGGVDGSSGGAEATGLSADDSGEGSAMGASMTVSETLEQSGGVISVRIVYFEFDSAKLTRESIEILEAHGNFIAANGEITIRLEGHADERGSREYNIALGDRRAQSVRRVLLFQGASVDQVETVSYGEEQPAMAGHTEEAWNLNRRAELIYTVN